MKNKIYVLSLLALAVSPPVFAQIWDEITDGGGDSGIQNSAQPVMFSGPLTVISGFLNQAGGDHVDCYQVIVDDVNTFYATSDPSVDLNAVPGWMDKVMWMWDATGTNIISGNDDTPGLPDQFATVADLSGPISYTAPPTAPVVTTLVNGNSYVVCVSYAPNFPLDSSGMDMINLGSLEALNGPDPAAGAFGGYMNSGSATFAPYSLAFSGAKGVLVNTADLNIDVTDSADPIFSGDPLSYTVNIENGGPDTANNVVITNTLSPDVTFIATSGCTEDPVGVPTCSIGNMMSGDSVSFTIDVTADPSFVGTLTHTSSVTSDATDPIMTNNSFVETTQVLAPTFSVGGTLTGLLIGNDITLQNNLGDDLDLTADGVYTFSTELVDADAYDVSVLVQPVFPNQTCVVMNASGTISMADVTNVNVDCDSFDLIFKNGFE